MATSTEEREQVHERVRERYSSAALEVLAQGVGRGCGLLWSSGGS